MKAWKSKLWEYFCLLNFETTFTYDQELQQQINTLQQQLLMVEEQLRLDQFHSTITNFFFFLQLHKYVYEARAGDCYTCNLLINFFVFSRFLKDIRARST